MFVPCNVHLCVLVAVVVSILTPAQAQCWTAPDATTPYTCGIKWTLTLGATPSSNHVAGTAVRQGTSSGVLAEDTGTTSTTIHVKADPTSSDFVTGTDVLVTGSTGNTYTPAKCVRNGNAEDPYLMDQDGTICTSDSGTYTAAACSNGGSAVSEALCENFVVIASGVDAAVNTGTSLGCSIWDLDCHGFVKPLQLASDVATTSDTEESEKILWRNILSSLSLNTDHGREFRNSLWRMKYTITFQPRAFQHVLERGNNGFTAASLDGTVKQGTKRSAVSVLGAMRYFVIYTLDGTKSFSGLLGYTPGIHVTQGCTPVNSTNCLLRGTLVSATDGNGRGFGSNVVLGDAGGIVKIVVQFDYPKMSASHAPTSTDDLIIYDSSNRASAAIQGRSCIPATDNVQCSNHPYTSATPCSSKSLGTCSGSGSCSNGDTNPSTYVHVRRNMVPSTSFNNRPDVNSDDDCELECTTESCDYMAFSETYPNNDGIGMPVTVCRTYTVSVGNSVTWQAAQGFNTYKRGTDELTSEETCTSNRDSSNSPCVWTATNTCSLSTTSISASQITGVSSKLYRCGVQPSESWAYDCNWGAALVARPGTEQNLYVTVEDGPMSSISFESEATMLSVDGGDIEFRTAKNYPVLTIKSSDIISVTSSLVEDYIYSEETLSQAADQKMYVVCGTQHVIQGALHLQDIPAGTAGLYINQCAANQVSSVNLTPRTGLGATQTLEELILDDTTMTSPPNVSAYINLNRLSISGIQTNGALTSLPNINQLVNLKYLDLSRQQGITMIPDGYFDNNVLLEELLLKNNAITALPVGRFDDDCSINACSILKVLNLRGNKIEALTSVNLQFPELETFDLRDNNIVVNESIPVPTNFFESMSSLKTLLLDNNKIKFISKNLLKKQVKLTTFGVSGQDNTFATLQSCPTNYYATQMLVSQVNYYACDLCAMGSNSEAYSCWTEFSDISTHYAPHVCPRGYYCDSTTKTKRPCPTGTFNLDIGVGSADGCKNCADGFYNPIQGQPICQFSCPPGKYGDHQGATPKNDTYCKACKIGNYCSGYGVVTPTQCPAGKYSSQTNGKSARDCMDCPASYYSSNVGLTSVDQCSQCPGGSTSLAGSTSQQNCVAGKVACPITQGYRPVPNQLTDELTCEQCAAGRYGNDGINCKLCPSGWVGPTVGAHACTECNVDACKFVGASVRIDSSNVDDMKAVPDWVGAGNKLDGSFNGLPNVTEVPIKRELRVRVIPNIWEYSLFLPAFVLCLSILLLHRWFPKSWCPYDHFSQQNEIKDTHAVRRVTSRIGGAFSWTLLIVASYLAYISISGRSYRTSTSDAPERAREFEVLTKKAGTSDQNSFGLILIDIEGYVPIDPDTLKKRCQMLKLYEQPEETPQPESTSGANTTSLDTFLDCKMERKLNDPTTCGITVACDTSFDIRGIVSVKISIPGEFQIIKWNVTSTTWEFFEKFNVTDAKKEFMRYRTTVNNTLTSGSSATIMRGTNENPSSVKFGLTRGYVVRVFLLSFFYSLLYSLCDTHFVILALCFWFNINIYLFTIYSFIISMLL